MSLVLYIQVFTQLGLSGRSDAILRMQVFLNETKTAAKTLKPCPDCTLSFYCSEAHWNTVKDAHQKEPCPTGYNNLSHCDMNLNAIQDAKFSHFMDGAGQGEFKWAPERTKLSWSSLHSLNWGDYKGDIQEGGMLPDNLVEPFLRGATDGLSMPMTILWGLENLNVDDSWTKKETLNIHVRIPFQCNLQLLKYPGLQGSWGGVQGIDACPNI